MATKNPFLLKLSLVIQLFKLGLDAGICHKCGKIFMKINGETLCKECQRPTFSHSFST